MSYAEATAVDAAEIPVIDIGPLRGGTDPQAVAAELGRASREAGFLYVRNHGIAEAAIETARAAALHFFAMAMEQKLEVEVNENHRGFIRVGEAFMTEDARQDLKESFVWGLEGAAPDDARFALAPLPRPNQWPTAMPGLKAALVPFFEAAQACALDLLRGFALSLDLPAETFTRHSDWPISRASITFYPPQPPEMGREQFGVAPHTDYGCLTVLAQDDVGGLQVQKSDGVWIAAPPIAGTLVINVGDLLARWTNGRFRSTPHRVVNSSGRARYSLVLACDPNYQSLVDPGIVCAGGEVPKQPPITCGEAIQTRMDRSFRYRRKS